MAADSGCNCVGDFSISGQERLHSVLCVVPVSAKETFIAAVERCQELPETVREAAKHSAIEVAFL